MFKVTHVRGKQQVWSVPEWGPFEGAGSNFLEVLKSKRTVGTDCVLDYTFRLQDGFLMEVR